MHLGLSFDYLLQYILLLMHYGSFSPKDCVSKQFCDYEEFQKSPFFWFDIVCPSIDYKEARRMFTCFQSSTEHIIQNAVLRFSTFTVVDSDLFNGLQIRNLDLCGVSNPQDLAFENIQKLELLTLEDGNMVEIPWSIRSLKNLKSLMLVNQTIENLPDFHFQEMESMEKLDLSFNSISEVGKKAFMGLDKLSGLNLSGNNFTSEINYIIGNLTSLTNLELRINKIHELGHQAFLNLTNLQELILSGNEMTIIHDEAFVGLKKLTSLYLNYNNLTFIPSRAIKNLGNLERFYFQENPITEIEPNAFMNLTLLKRVFVGCKTSSNQIRENSFAGLQDRLTTLSLYGVNLTSAPAHSFQNLSKLKVLILNSNHITEWKPTNFLGFTSLEELYLSGNIDGINQKDAFAGFPKLNKLTLYNCNLTSVPSDALRNLSSTVKWVDLKNNQITELKNSAFFGTTLEWLWLGHNPISTIHSGAFAGLEGSLKVLELRDAKLTRIPVEALQNMGKLEEVHFGNLIEYIDADTFKEFGQTIVSINLAGNRIKSFAKSAFHHLPNLKVLNLRNNQLHHLDLAVYQPIIIEIRSFNVIGNPLECTCELYWFYELSLKISSSFYTTWFAEHQREHNIESNECLHNGTIVNLEQECKQE